MFHHCYSLLNDSFVLILLSIHTELHPSAWALRIPLSYKRRHN
jgi:hypothetical protein